MAAGGSSWTRKQAAKYSGTSTAKTRRTRYAAAASKGKARTLRRGRYYNNELPF